jgi:TraM recognition site of TraD and TraG
MTSDSARSALPRRSPAGAGGGLWHLPAHLRALERKGATETAKRLGVDAPGLTIAKTVAGGRVLYQGWEDTALDIAGPRTGKTTARVIPAILEAPGAVVTTSNKRDAVDATRGPRSAVGPVWVFDPQKLIDEPANWWWNPLRYVTDEVKAANLAEVFTAAYADPQARTDAFFDPKGQKVVAALLLASALAGATIEQTYLWVTDPRDDEPVSVLREHGYQLLAASLAAEINAPDKQRGGVYGTAEKILAFLTNRNALRWVTPGAGRIEFVPAAFVRGTGTLYSLSKEGKGSAGALVAGLAVAVTEAAEEHAKRSPGGRLPVPLVVVLDEAANVCRWPELPNLYSHYGSRGICLLTMLQSWSQGVEVWGRDGMRKLWSAATINVAAGLAPPPSALRMGGARRVRSSAWMLRLILTSPSSRLAACSMRASPRSARSPARAASSRERTTRSRPPSRQTPPLQRRDARRMDRGRAQTHRLPRAQAPRAGPAATPSPQRRHRAGRAQRRQRQRRLARASPGLAARRDQRSRRRFRRAAIALRARSSACWRRGCWLIHGPRVRSPSPPRRPASSGTKA